MVTLYSENKCFTKCVLWCSLYPLFCHVPVGISFGDFFLWSEKNGSWWIRTALGGRSVPNSYLNWHGLACAPLRSSSHHTQISWPGRPSLSPFTMRPLCTQPRWFSGTHSLKGPGVLLDNSLCGSEGLSVNASRGYRGSSVGRMFAWHSRGPGFDPWHHIKQTW